MKKVIDFLKLQVEWIRYSKMGRMLYSIAFSFIFFLLSNLWEPLYYVSLALLVYPAILFAYMMAYAWIINPINSLRERLRNKKNAK